MAVFTMEFWKHKKELIKSQCEKMVFLRKQVVL